MNYSKILIVNLGGIGDFLLSAPALKALRARYPQARISALVAARCAGAARFLPYIDETFVFHIGYAGRIPFLRVFSNVGTLLLLRSRRFDLAVNMRTLVSARSASKIRLLLNIIGPKIKAGRDTEGRGGFFDIKVPETLPGEKYEMEYDLDTALALDAGAFDRNIELRLDESAGARVQKLLENAGVPRNALLIGIHPGGRPSSRWPLEGFSGVISRLNKSFGAYFVVTGGKDESALADALKTPGADKVVDLTGKLDFKELCALIKRCGLYITNDTGPMHIAAILKTPLVAIFGGGYLNRYDPRSIFPPAQVLCRHVDCSPCDRAVCSSLKCLRSITPQEVADAAARLLKG